MNLIRTVLYPDNQYSDIIWRKKDPDGYSQWYIRLFILAAYCVRFHSDEEDALINAFTDLMGGEILLVGCRFHKIQNLLRHAKDAFPAR